MEGEGLSVCLPACLSVCLPLTLSSNRRNLIQRNQAAETLSSRQKTAETNKPYPIRQSPVNNRLKPLQTRLSHARASKSLRPFVSVTITIKLPFQAASPHPTTRVWRSLPCNGTNRWNLIQPILKSDPYPTAKTAKFRRARLHHQPLRQRPLPVVRHPPPPPASASIPTTGHSPRNGHYYIESSFLYSRTSTGYITSRQCPPVLPRGDTTQRARGEIFKLSFTLHILQVKISKTSENLD